MGIWKDLMCQWYQQLSVGTGNVWKPDLSQRMNQGLESNSKPLNINIVYSVVLHACGRRMMGVTSIILCEHLSRFSTVQKIRC